MSCGMVRKIDELGRVVLPKEMRRVLNIKTGSSVEMIIENNKIVLYKFSEVENVLSLGNKLGELLYEKLNLKCLICDDDLVLNVFGESKKEFLHKKIKVESNFKSFSSKLCEIVDSERQDLVQVYPISLHGFTKGYIIAWGEKESDEFCIKLLTDFFATLIDD